MRASQIEIINNGISYQEGKIIFEPNRGYTSELMKRLYDLGYRASTSGIMHYLYDTDNKLVCSSHSWVCLLEQTAKTFN